MRYLKLLFLLMGVGLWSCSSDSNIDIVYPLEYYPAYPGTYWDYSNGTRVRVNPDYELHSYFSSIQAEESTDEKYVPVVNGQYLYEYSITQSSTTYPLKKLLSTSVNENWTVDNINQKKLNRQVIDVEGTLTISGDVYHTGADTSFTQLIVVVEYLEELGAENWSIKEYYAKDLGLVRREVADPTSGVFVVEKELVTYYINK